MHNVRNCKYFANDVYIVDYYDKTIDMNRSAASITSWCRSTKRRRLRT